MGSDGRSSGRAPLLGEHTEEVLRDVAGISPNDVQAAATEATA